MLSAMFSNIIAENTFSTSFETLLEVIDDEFIEESEISETLHKNENIEDDQLFNKDEEIIEILKKPFIPIQTPVPLRPLSKQAENSNNSSSKKHSIPKSKESIQKKLCISLVERWACNPHSPVYLECVRAIYNEMSTEQFYQPSENWSLPETSKKVIHFSLLEKKLLDEEDLNEDILDKITLIGFQNLKDLVGKCAKEALPILAEKTPFDVEKIIQTNVERKPLLDAKDFISKLIPIINLVNKQDCNKEKLIAYTQFLQDLSCFPKDEYSFSIEWSDCLIILMAQLKNAPLKNLPLFEKEKLETTAWTTSSYIKHLNENSSLLDEETFEELTHQVEVYLKSYKEDESPTELANYRRSLWQGSGDMVFGVLPIFRECELFDAAVSLLDSRAPLMTHPQAVNLLNTFFFEGKLELISLLLYKTWWFATYLHSGRDSLANRLLDWHMVQFLEDSRVWKLEETVQYVKFLFQTNYPYLPFNSPRAERMFFALKLGEIRT